MSFWKETRKHTLMTRIIPIKTGTVQEVIDALQTVKNKNAILLCDPTEDTDPWPFKSLQEDGDFVMLSTDKYAPQ